VLEALALANGAYQIIRQTIQNGAELSSAGKAIANFVGAEDQLQQDLHKKKNSIWTNFIGKTDNDLEEFMALEEIRRKKEILREYMQLYGRANLYTDYIQFCAEARKNRKQSRLDAHKRTEKIKDVILKVVLGILMTALFSGVITVLAIIARKRGLI
jgi:hypothetical protein|tara:strand:+ start:4862 stop:5332 length:471 start_codon:yes stop_codon:yes gene_type:complete